MAAEITQLSKEDYKNFWTRRSKIPITVLALHFLLIIEGQYLRWLDRGEDVIMKELKIFQTFFEGQRDNGCRNYSTKHGRQYDFFWPNVLKFILQSWLNFLLIIEGQYLG